MIGYVIETPALEALPRPMLRPGLRWAALNALVAAVTLGRVRTVGMVTHIRRGTFRHYVATEARAQEECAKAAGRTYRAMATEEMPPAARENLERAASQ